MAVEVSMVLILLLFLGDDVVILDSAYVPTSRAWRLNLSR